MAPLSKEERQKIEEEKVKDEEVHSGPKNEEEFINKVVEPVNL